MCPSMKPSECRARVFFTVDHGSKYLHHGCALLEREQTLRGLLTDLQLKHNTKNIAVYAIHRLDD